VIPFFERDLCKLKYTAKSISVNDPSRVFGKIHLMWTSETPSADYQADIDEVKADIARTHEVDFKDFQPLMANSNVSGWHLQQVLKLKMASEVASDYYIVLDSKNTIIKPIKLEDFFTPCNQGIIQAEFPWYKIPVPHSDWYARSAAALGVSKPGSRYWPASITPIVMHKPSVLSMLSMIGEGTNTDELCDGTLCKHLGGYSESGHGATEFTLYTLFVYKNPTGKTDLTCIHDVQNIERFKIPYSSDWKLLLDAKLRQSKVPMDRRQLTVSDGKGFPIAWDPSQENDPPAPSEFPLKFEDLTKRWSASLWRGEASNQALLEVVNTKTLEDIVNGVRQFPVMFGAQPAATKVMSPDMRAKAVNNLLLMYNKANLYHGGAKTLEECVVGVDTGDA